MMLKQRIPERAAMFVNMKTVLSRVDKRGQLEPILKAITDARNEEDSELGQELLGDPQEVDNYSRIFKENFKVLLGILGTSYQRKHVVDEVWNQPSHTTWNSNASTQMRSDELSQTKDNTVQQPSPKVRTESPYSGEHSRPYSIGPEDHCTPASKSHLKS